MSFIIKYCLLVNSYFSIYKRFYKDFNSKYSFAKRNLKKTLECPFELSIIQPIEFISPYTKQSQIQNLKLAANKIEKYIILPNQVFSFWRIVGKPVTKNGFEKEDINHKKIQDYGENLRQLSGIIYYLSLLGGIQTLERYNYPTDIYSEEQRIYPLGSDAYISYFQKDLRIKNNYTFAIKFKFIIENNHIKGSLFTEKKILPNKINFKRTDYKNYKEILTRINRRTVAFSKYNNLK